MRYEEENDQKRKREGMMREDWEDEEMRKVKNEEEGKKDEDGMKVMERRLKLMELNEH